MHRKNTREISFVVLTPEKLVKINDYLLNLLEWAHSSGRSIRLETLDNSALK